MKKPTDKQRMDWLEKEKADVYYGRSVVVSSRPYIKSAKGKTARIAIDAAMKLQRKAGK